MNQSGLEDLSLNQQSSGEKKKLKIKFKQEKKIIDMTDCQQKNVIQSQNELERVCEQRLKPSVSQVQSNYKVFKETQSEKQVQQFDQDFGQQQLDREVLEKTPFQIELTGITPRFKQDDWNSFTLHNSQFNAYMSKFENEFWLRLVCHDQGQVLSISDSEIIMDDLIHLLMITSHIGISSRSNKFKEDQNIIKIDVKTFKSNEEGIFQQLLNVANGMTPEGKSWKDRGSSKTQLKIVGEIKNKEIVEFIIGGQDSKEKNIFLSLVKYKETIKTILYEENKIRSIWLKIFK